MTQSIDRQVTDLQGRAALPRKNGELVFEHPWEGRVFGLALALRARRPYPWAEFRDRLETEIATAGDDDAGLHYYEWWTRAFESVLVDEGIVSREELARRTWEYRRGLRDEVF
jgi:nitrile hydratase accessory protein